MGLHVVFNSVYLDRVKKILKLSGYVNPITNDNGGMAGSNIFRIFVAKLVKGKLKDIRLLAEVEDTIRNRSEETAIDLNNFNFKTEFKFSKDDCFYIEGSPMFRLKEYFIGSLLKPNR